MRTFLPQHQTSLHGVDIIRVLGSERSPVRSHDAVQTVELGTGRWQSGQHQLGVGAAALECGAECATSIGWFRQDRIGMCCSLASCPQGGEHRWRRRVSEYV